MAVEQTLGYMGCVGRMSFGIEFGEEARLRVRVSDFCIEFWSSAVGLFPAVALLAADSAATLAC